MDHIIGLEDRIVNAKLYNASVNIVMELILFAVVMIRQGRPSYYSRFEIGICQLPRNSWETEQAQTDCLLFAHPSNKATGLQISIFDTHNCNAISLSFVVQM